MLLALHKKLGVHQINYKSISAKNLLPVETVMAIHLIIDRILSLEKALN